MNGIFGDLFDLNRDGKVDFLEQVVEFAFIDDLLSEDEHDDEDDETEDESDDDF